MDISNIINVDKNTLSRIMNIIRQVGIYESFKALMKQSFFREAVKKKLDELYIAIVDKYDIVDHNMTYEIDENGKCRVVIELDIPDENNRKEFVKRLKDTVKNVLESKFSMIPPFLKEFEIENINCKEREDKVYVTIYGNEKLMDLVSGLGGVMNEEAEKSRSEAD